MTVPEQREVLAAWLAEWRLEKELPPPQQESGVLTEDEDSALEPNKTIGATETALHSGDIVLLPPDGETSSVRPVYVVLLTAKADGSWLCAPFSRFSTPATEGEYATGRSFDPLKVVCAWNAGQLSQAVLERGWQVERLGAADLKILTDFALNRRDELPPSKCGPPIVHPLDPRHEYIEEERCLWIDFLSLDVDEPEVWQVRESSIGYAAEDHPESDL